VATELGSHNKPQVEMIDPSTSRQEVLAPEDIAYVVIRPRQTAIGELWIMPCPPTSSDRIRGPERCSTISSTGLT
jgi:hypothetical protein